MNLTGEQTERHNSDVTHFACGATIHDAVWEEACTGSTVH